MGFLYGDSTPSPLTSNFLEFLRDALDFAVFALRADEAIRQIQERLQGQGHAADAETERLEAFGRIVEGAIDGAPKGEADSATSRCAEQLASLSAENIRASVEALRRTLAGQVERAKEEEGVERSACLKALEGLLLPHAPPGAKTSARVELGPLGYRAELVGEATFGLAWRIELAIPEGHVFATAAPLEKLAPSLAFGAPSQTGWLKKEVRVRPQRLERLVMTQVTDDGQSVNMKLRFEVEGEQGFDVAIEPASSVVGAARVGASEDASVGPFHVPDEDVPKLVSLAERLRAAVAELRGSRLVGATLDGGDFKLQPQFRNAVERLVAVMGPIVHDIARHTLTPTELVLRRLLSDERREELFVQKSTLREKYAPLPRELRGLFDGLGLDTLPPPPPRPRSQAPSEARPESRLPAPVERPAQALAPPPLRRELARSEPPPPPVSPPQAGGPPALAPQAEDAPGPSSQPPTREPG
jgi:hypothetical protein